MRSRKISAFSFFRPSADREANNSSEKSERRNSADLLLEPQNQENENHKTGTAEKVIRRSSNNKRPEGTTEHLVTKDETLSKIAAMNKMSVSELLNVNKLMTLVLIPGQVIWVPKKIENQNCSKDGGVVHSLQKMCEGRSELTCGAPKVVIDEVTNDEPNLSSSEENNKTDVFIESTGDNSSKTFLEQEQEKKNLNPSGTGDIVKQDIKRERKYTKQRSVSEYSQPRLDQLQVPRQFQDEIIKEEKEGEEQKKRKSFTSIFEQLHGILGRPPSSHAVQHQGTKLRSLSTAVEPQRQHLETSELRESVGDIFKRRSKRLFGRKSESSVGDVRFERIIKPVTLEADAILFGIQLPVHGTLVLNSQGISFESISAASPASYVYFTLESEFISVVGLWKLKRECAIKMLRLNTTNQFELVQNKLEFGVNEEIVDGQHEMGIDENEEAKKNQFYDEGEKKKICYLCIEGLLPDEYASFKTKSSKISNLWFSINNSKTSEVNEYFCSALPHHYLNLPENMKEDLYYSLHVTLVQGIQLVDLNEDGFLNTLVKFKRAKTTLYKSRDVRSGFNPKWMETFVIDNVSYHDNLRVIATHVGSKSITSYIGESAVQIKSLKPRLVTPLRLHLEDVKKHHDAHFDLGSIQLTCQLIPKNSSVGQTDLKYPSLLQESNVLNRSHVWKLHVNLPIILRAAASWDLVYSTDVHGSSLMTLYSKMADCDEDDHVILAIKDSESKIFGAFLTSPLKPSKSFYGSGQCFLFCFDPAFQKFQWTGNNYCFIIGSGESITIGAGKSGAAGIWLYEDLVRGRTDICDTFDNIPLTPTKDFFIISLEIWRIRD